MHHLTPAKDDAGFDFVTGLQKFASVFDFEIEIVIFNFGAKANFFDMDYGLFLATGLFFLAQLILVLSIVHDFADGWISIRRDFDKIIICLRGARQRFLCRDDANLFAIRAYDPNLWDPDLIIDPDEFLLDTLSPLSGQYHGAASPSADGFIQDVLTESLP